MSSLQTHPAFSNTYKEMIENVADPPLVKRFCCSLDCRRHLKNDVTLFTSLLGLTSHHMLFPDLSQPYYVIRFPKKAIDISLD